MSFGTVEKPPDQRRPYNVNDAETSSNQENIPVPYFCGVAKLAGDPVSPLYNLTSKKVKQQGDAKGKGGGSGDSGQKNWYADFALRFNVCADDAPNDAILNALVNGEPVLAAPLFRAPGTHYVAFSLPKFCQACRFYWGTKDQPIDNLVLYPRQDAVPTGVNPRDISTWPRLDASGEPVDDVTDLPGVSNPKSGHYDIWGAMRNQGYMVARQFFLGSSPNMPTVEFILARGAAFFAGGRFEAGDNGVNPMGMPYEIFTDPMFGAGAQESRLVQSSFQATADALDAQGIALAPAFRESKPARSLFADFFQYYDGFFRRSGNAIEAGYFDHGEIDVGALQVIGNAELTENPKITPGDVKDTKNSFFVAYTNRDKWYKDDDTEGYIDQANYDRVGVQRDDRLERRHIISGDLAMRHCVEWGSIFALEVPTGSIACRRDRINGLRPGKRFKSNDARLNLSFVWRVKAAERPSDRDGTIKFTLEGERGVRPALFLPAPGIKPPDFEIKPAGVEHQRIVELPSGLKDSSALQVQVLWERPTNDILGIKVHVSQDDDLYTLARTQHHYAVRGKVAVAYSAARPDLDTAIGLVVDLFGVDLDTIGGQIDSERDDNHLLAWGGNEIFSIGERVALGNGRFRFYNRGALYGTAKANHFIGEEVWFIFRDWLERVEDKNFVPGGTAFFKLQPFIYGGDYDIDLVDSIAHAFAGGAVSPIFNLQLTTTARIAAGQIESRIAATWDYRTDQDIFAFEVAIKRTSDSTWGQTRGVNTPSTDWEVAPLTSYDVRVRPINSHGEPGAWCDPATIVSVSISPFSITGLEVDGQGNDTEVRERDIKLACRLNSPSSGVTIGGVVQTGVQDPAFSYILWQAFVGGVLVYQEQTVVPKFQLTEAKNEAAYWQNTGTPGKYGKQGQPITFNVYAVDSLRNISAPAILTVQNSPSVAPGNLQAFAANNRTILLSWNIGPETDNDEIWILRNTTNNPNTATIIAKVHAKNTTYVDTLPGVTGSVEFFYWVRAHDTFGNLSPFSAEAHATSDPLAASIADVEDFEIDVTKVFLGKIVVLKGDTWSVDSPTAGSIAWNAHQIIFNGQKFDIPAGHTALKYIYWNAGASVYTPSDTPLPLSSDRFLVYQNVGGVPRALWNVFANAVIGSANIIELAVKNAHIENLAIEKVLAGIILGKEFVLQNTSDAASVLRSTDYVPGVSGVIFGVDEEGVGFLEVNEGFFRGTIRVGSSTLADIAAAAALGASDPASRINAGTTSIAGGKIVVNGSTSFGAGYDPTGKIPAGHAADDVNANSTTIDGGKITTDTVEAHHLKTDTVLGKRFYIGPGGSIESTDYVAGPSGAGFHVGEDGIEINAGVFRDGVVIRTLAAPTFTNDYDGTPLTDRTWNDNDLIAFRAHGPSGKKIRFTTDGSEVTPNSPYWPDYPTGTGDGVGPDNFLGFNLPGSTYSGLIRARAVSGPSGEVLGVEATLRLTKVPIDLLPLPQAPLPVIYFSGGTRGASGYRVKIANLLGSGTIKWSADDGATFSDYSPTGNYQVGGATLPTSNAGEISLAVNAGVLAYVVADGYAPSATQPFYNTARDPVDPGWTGPYGKPAP